MKVSLNRKFNSFSHFRRQEKDEFSLKLIYQDLLNFLKMFSKTLNCGVRGVIADLINGVLPFVNNMQQIQICKTELSNFENLIWKILLILFNLIHKRLLKHFFLNDSVTTLNNKKKQKTLNFLWLLALKVTPWTF